eukprot:TRINITY_DN14351_c0_g1_i1.p1 TRINITY_DN14351_c0_g1~~TRINITY_DN14351_c0_g1_i1.p1  ORF type:complete len:669 (+),score=121.02 TRINITY_DN14351_c0_g1_i1:33-2009(+)
MSEIRAIVAASPAIDTHRIFDNLRARWPESQVSHAFIGLYNTSAASLPELTSSLDKKVSGLSLSITFSSVRLSDDEKSVWFIPSDSSSKDLVALGADQQSKLVVYSGPNAKSVLQELESDHTIATFTFLCDGLSVILGSQEQPVIYTKRTGPWSFKTNNYIDGEWRSPVKGQWMQVFDPSTGAPFHNVASSTAEDVNNAVKAAQKAFETWSFTTAETRANYLKAIADELEKRKPYLTTLESLDNGKSLEESEADMDDTIGCFRYYAEQILEFEAQKKTISVDVGNPSFEAHVTHEPMGVAALIVPWNYPLLMAAWKVAPCLAAGCTCVLKPSELTPLSAFELADVMHSVGVPKGVFNLIVGNGPDSGSPLSSHPDVSKVAFTGSVPTGSSIAAAGASTIKKVSLELGGKSPAIVCADADIEQAIDWITVGIFFNSGQVCSATSRLLVHSSVATKLVDGLVSRARNIRVGPGSQPNVKMGPLVSLGQFNKVLGYIESGVNQGATLVCGGGKHTPYVPNDTPSKYSEGYFVGPTIFTNVKPFMKIWKEEIFGPVLSVMTYENEDDAIALANDSSFGLAGAIFSTNPEKCNYLSRRLQCGIVWINCSQPTFVQLPWGGQKKSGTGRELGPWGLMNYLEPKQVCSWVATDSKGWDWFASSTQ